MAVAEIGVDGNVEVSTPTLEQITEAQVTQGENIEKTMGHQGGTARGARSVPSTKAALRLHCEQKCKAAGHCGTGATSSAQHPSCAMGCSASQHTGSVSECKATCHTNDNTCKKWNLGGITQYNCGECSGGSGFAEVQDCLDGCHFGFPASCEDSCAKAGHCCTGATSSAQHPSCAMGCQAARHTGSVSECKATCHTNDNTCKKWNLGGITQYNCGECSGGCGLAEVQECLDGCEFGWISMSSKKAALRAAKKLAEKKRAKKKLLKASVKILTDARILTCEDSCAKAGHCCTGATSSAKHPSCAMGCQAARHTGSVSECKATCHTNDNTCNWNLGGMTQDNCGECSGGCGKAEVQECLDGCEFGFGSSMSFMVAAQNPQRFWNCKLSK